MRLFYSLAVIAWATNSLATPPPGYVKKPSTDKDPPAYEYKYEIGDDTGKGQGKAETRAGEFASGSYYVKTGDASTDVKYFADDWGYHPVVKYGTTDSHGSTTTTHLALGEHAVKAFRNGGEIGRKVILPGENGKRKSVQIIQPYTVGENDDPEIVTPTYQTLAVEESESGATESRGQDSRESRTGGKDLLKESRVPLTTLIPPLSYSTTPQQGLLVLGSTFESTAAPLPEATTPSEITFAPRQELRNIYAKNDYENAALIDEQLFLQSSAGGFGKKVHASSLGETGLRGKENPTTTTLLPPFHHHLTKQNGDVTYTIHSGSNANTAYLSATGSRLQSWHELSSKTSTSTESSIIHSSTSSSTEYGGNDLPGEINGPTNPQLVNYAFANGGFEADYESEKSENEVQTKSSGVRESFGTFSRPIVVAEIKPGYQTTRKCADDVVANTTPTTPVNPTTSQTVNSAETIHVTQDSHSQNRGTTSSVILNPIQAGVTLVHAGESHLISNHVKEYSDASFSENLTSSSQSAEGENSHVKEEEEEEKQLEETVARLEEEIQLQQVQQIQQEFELQKNQQRLDFLDNQQRYEALEPSVKEILSQWDKDVLEKYRYQLLKEEAEHEKEVELQQVEESQQNEQLPGQIDGQLIHKLLQEAELGDEQRNKIAIEEIKSASRQEEGEVRVENSGEQLSYESNRSIEAAVEKDEGEARKELEKYQQASNSFLGDSVVGIGGDQRNIEIQKSIEIYHNEPVQEIHYPGQVAAQVESSDIDQQSGIRHQEYVENTQQSYRGHEESGAGVSFEFNQPLGHEQEQQQQQQQQQSHLIAEKDQSSLGAENQAQQVLLEGVGDLNQGLDLTRSNALPQQIFTDNVGAVFNVDGTGGQYDEKQLEEQQHYVENDPKVLGIDQQIGQLQQVVLSQNGGRAYQLNQENQYQSQSHAYSQAHSHSHSYESNLEHQQQQQQHHQQQVVVGVGVHGIPYTLEPSKELVIPGISSGSVQPADNPIFKNYVTLSISDHYPINSGDGQFQHQSLQAGHEIIEKQIAHPHQYAVGTVIEKKVPYPVEVEKVVEKQVPYPIERVVEKHIPVPQPYAVHIKVPQPYPVETIVEKPVRVHVPVTKIVEKKVPVPQPYPVEVTKYVDKPVHIHVPQPYPVEKIVEKTVHVPHPYPVEKIVERIVEKPVQIRVPYAVEVVKNVPYGVQYGVSYQQIMRPHSHSLYVNHGGSRPLYGLPTASRFHGFRHQNIGHGELKQQQQYQSYNYEKPGVIGFLGGSTSDQISAGNQQIQFKHFGKIQQQNLCNGNKFNPHLHHQIGPHFSARRHVIRSSQKEPSRTEEYIGPVPPHRSQLVRHHQIQQRIVPQSSTSATRSPDLTTTSRRAREPEAKPQSSPGNFRQSRVEYGFKPPMIPSIQYDEETASKVES